jgi:hypothetical protein
MLLDPYSVQYNFSIISVSIQYTASLQAVFSVTQSNSEEGFGSG